jgi:type I restriction-modification system DNA methylase subunit
MDQSQLKWIADFIWNIADDRLRDVYVRGKYRDVILPFTVLRRLDAVLEATKDAVLGRPHRVIQAVQRQPELQALVDRYGVRYDISGGSIADQCSAAIA